MRQLTCRLAGVSDGFREAHDVSGGRVTISKPAGRFAAACRRPCGAWEMFVLPAPRAEARGYMPVPLRGPFGQIVNEKAGETPALPGVRLWAEAS